MENKIIDEQKKKLLSTLSPRQKDYLEAIDWLYNGARATGRTHLTCVTALIHVLHGQEGLVLEHVPYNEASASYTKRLLLSLADSIDLKIKIREVRNGFIVSRNVPYWYEERKNEEK